MARQRVRHALACHVQRHSRQSVDRRFLYAGVARTASAPMQTLWEDSPQHARLVNRGLVFGSFFVSFFGINIDVHPDVTKYAREDDMLLKRGARGGRETKRLEQRSAALTCARGLHVSARWHDRGRLGALSKTRRAPRAQRMGAARKGARWRCARWSVDCSEALACGVAANGAASIAYGIAGWPLC